MATIDTALEIASLEGVLREYRHRVTVEEYRRMEEAGVFGDARHVEPLEGVLVEKMTKDPPHVIATDLIQAALARMLPAGFFASMGNPLVVDERASEPEPDGAVFRGSPRDSIGRARQASEALLVIEVLTRVMKSIAG